MPTFQFSIDINKLKSGAADAIKIMNGVRESADTAAAGVASVGKASSSAASGMNVFGKSAQDVKSNLRSLAAQIVGLIGVYKTLEGAMSFVKRGMDFSSSLEASEISIASVVAATNNITTAEGKALQGVEKFNAARGISKDIMEEVQVLALQTTATFDSLADGVAGIVAPATKAGVSLEKLPKFAVAAAQAMATMRIPVQQMRTEIESLLSGNINKAQDLLATNLGITGEMVKNWQKQGVLVDELNKRFDAFVIAGAEVADSWAGLKGNMQDALNYLSGQSGKGIFESAKQSYRELLDLMVSTEGKVGVGKDLENIMRLITDIQDAIGEGLLSATREFIDELRELNKPENLEKFKEDLEYIWNSSKNAFESIKSVGSVALDLFKDIAQGWQNLPEPIREYGLIIALLGGVRLKMALAALSMASRGLAVLDSLQSGNLDRYDLMAAWQDDAGFIDSILEKTEKLKKAKEDASRAPSLSPYRGQDRINANYGGTDKAGGKPTYHTSSAIGGFTSGKKTGKSEAEKFAERSERYAADLKKLRNEVEALEQSLDPTLTSFEKMAARIDAEREAAIKNADVKAAETIRRKEATAAQAEETAGLEKRKAELTAQQKLEELQNKSLQERASFYQDLAAKTGEYGTSLEYQNQLLDKQRAEWAGIVPNIDDVNKMMELQRRELSRSPWDGWSRAADKAFAEATNGAKLMERAFSTVTGDLASSLTDLAMGAEVNFNDILRSWNKMLIEMAMQAAVTGFAKHLGTALDCVVTRL